MNHLKIIFINSHPIQYFTPLYKYMNVQGIQTACWYCSDENVKGHTDRGFQSKVAWDIPILEGYESRFFRNYSWKPSLYNGFFGLINLSLLKAIFAEKKSVFVIHGWAYLTHVFAIITARLAGHVVCLRGETPIHQELLKSKMNRLVKTLFLQGFLFRFINWFLFIGSQNRSFYRFYGVSDHKLLFTPYSIDNVRFSAAARQLLTQKKMLREGLGLPVNARIILFSAKYIHKKRPIDLLQAYKELRLVDKCLVMVGEGELRMKMEAFVREHNLMNVYLTGFVNQTEIVKYYAIADVFVLCSGEGETWGLSANEAMNFDLPLVVSDMSGCSADLVKEGENGYVSILGDIQDLTRKIEGALQLNGNKGKDLIEKYSFKTIANSFKEILR